MPAKPPAVGEVSVTVGAWLLASSEASTVSPCSSTMRRSPFGLGISSLKLGRLAVAAPVSKSSVWSVSRLKRRVNKTPPPALRSSMRYSPSPAPSSVPAASGSVYTGCNSQPVATCLPRTSR